jgi:hypothetical protein
MSDKLINNIINAHIYSILYNIKQFDKQKGKKVSSNNRSEYLTNPLTVLLLFLAGF